MHCESLGEKLKRHLNLNVRWEAMPSARYNGQCRGKQLVYFCDQVPYPFWPQQDLHTLVQNYFS